MELLSLFQVWHGVLDVFQALVDLGIIESPSGLCRFAALDHHGYDLANKQDFNFKTSVRLLFRMQIKIEEEIELRKEKRAKITSFQRVGTISNEKKKRKEKKFQMTLK